VTPSPIARTSSLDDTLLAELGQLRDRHLERQLRSTARRRGAVVETERGSAVDFSSNDYLGLASDERLAAAAVAAMHEHGVGASAARLIAGNSPEHEALERELADLFGAERALTFSSGYAANVGTIPALVSRGDVIFADALNHASLIDGCRLSRATVHVYAHADTNQLDALLDRHRAGARRALIVTDGLFSMDGDRAPLAEIVELAQRFDAWTYVDDAHAVGVMGNGLGSASAVGCAGEVDVTIGTLGKAFGAAGAFVYGSETLVQYLLTARGPSSSRPRCGRHRPRRRVPPFGSSATSLRVARRCMIEVPSFGLCSWTLASRLPRQPSDRFYRWSSATKQEPWRSAAHWRARGSS
jgi:7-keto-8-aminopelargonate synthetase-like enzyme